MRVDRKWLPASISTLNLRVNRLLFVCSLFVLFLASSRSCRCCPHDTCLSSSKSFLLFHSPSRLGPLYLPTATTSRSCSFCCCTAPVPTQMRRLNALLSEETSPMKQNHSLSRYTRLQVALLWVVLCLNETPLRITSYNQVPGTIFFQLHLSDNAQVSSGTRVVCVANGGMFVLNFVLSDGRLPCLPCSRQKRRRPRLRICSMLGSAKPSYVPVREASPSFGRRESPPTREVFARHSRRQLCIGFCLGLGGPASSRGEG